MALDETITPASTITGLTVGEGGVLSLADQQAATVTISGVLSAALPAGDTVQIVLPSGVPRPAVVAADGTEFSLVLTGRAATAFSIPGQVSAYVADPDGNQSTPFTQIFTAAAARSVLPVTSTPTDFSISGASALALSGDGKSVAFVGRQVVGNSVQFGLYVQRLDTGTVTLVAPSGNTPSLSADGHLIAYEANTDGLDQYFLKDLTTGLITPLSDPMGGSTSGPASSRPGLANDGTIVFESAGDTSLDDDPYQQVFIARVSGGVATRTLISAAADETPANADSEYGTISADGSTVVFLSKATNLLGAGDAHAPALNGTFQIYAYALRDNAATGQRAGTTMLVSGNPDGTISDGTDYNPVVSGDGRFVLYQSVDGNSQVHLADLLTGTSRIVSTNADGVAANAGAFGATLSADGNTVVFETAATNLLSAGDAAPDLSNSQQIYAKNLTTGQVTLLSEGGFTPGDAVSQDPAVSADGTVAAFASNADNLTPGVLGSANPFPTSRGYVTTIAGTPALAINGPATAATTTIVLTGTIDPGHATTPITLTDAADPGFLPVTATVTAGSDPYLDTWTATVIFTQAGAQTVTAAAGDATAQTTITLLNAPSLTIDPAGGTGSITATGQAGHATTVSGTNPAGLGGTVSLSLRSDDGKLLPLGTATTGPDGVWSVSVPDSALGVRSSDGDALIAETVDANGTISRAAERVALTIAAPVTLYSYRFTYIDGSFYTGTIADDGTYGYAPGQTITTSAGRYTIGAASGATSQAPGTVTAASYFDVSTASTDTPTAAANGVTDGTGGLGSETDSITGPGGLLNFGGGVTEARGATATAYDFAYVYNDGSAYFGTVVGGAGTGYQAGQILKNSSGSYKITGSAGASTASIGTVSTSLYYDASTAATYVPVAFSQGQSSGVNGLGSELDTLSTSAGTVKFGLSGVDKAAFKLIRTYFFDFAYKDGSFYNGEVVDDGTYGYALNETIKVRGGTYSIQAVSLGAVTVGGQLLIPGEVAVVQYFDKTTQQFYTPINYASGQVAGFKGLGSEIDDTNGISGNVAFGVNGTLEAKQAPNQRFTFSFAYKDGSYYLGDVIDDGTYGYYVGETIHTAYGFYSIQSAQPAPGGAGNPVTGDVFTTTYFDITSHATYATLDSESGIPGGTAGLGSEDDFIIDATLTAHPFGEGGKLEAKVTPYTLLNFSFTYKDGSLFVGTLSSDGVNGPKVGQIITTAYGAFDVYSAAGPTAATPGTVQIFTYFDISDHKSYTPTPIAGSSNYGTSGLLTALGTIDGTLNFGDGGLYEAKHGLTSSWEFEFFYPDGSSYIGHVVANGAAGFHAGFTLATPYGYYAIDGSTSATSLPIGSVTLNYYYDSSTGKVYLPTGQGPDGIDGTTGLGSELASTTFNGNELPFGRGGLYEAKQSDTRHFTFTFRYDDGSFYQGDFASFTHLYLPGTIIRVPGGFYNIITFDDEHSAIPAGTVHVSSYFDIGTGKFYTPVRYAEGVNAGTGDIGSELDYIFAGGGLRSFGGPAHQEANTKLSTTLLLNTARYAFDGPIQGATIGYLDPQAPPGVLRIDPDQPTGVTNADGSYQLDPGTGPLVLTGGTDTATLLPFKGVLESAGAGSVLSPLTTLLEAVAVARGDTSVPGIAAASDLLAAALGLPAGLDLSTYAPGQILRDPATSPNDIPGAAAIYRAGATLLDIETLIDAAGGQSQVAVNTLAADLADGTVTDLTDLSPLIEDGVLAAPAETAIKAIVIATNAALDQQLAGVTVPAAILALISGGSIALQGDAATALAAPNADDAAVADIFVQTLSTTLVADDKKAFGVNAPCYCPGTAILTDRGEIAVEQLQIGDRVITGTGAAEPVVWIGHRHYAGAFVAGNHLMLPVCVKRNALADGVPRRDLWVSPGHALFVDGQLVPAWRLVNGVSVTQAEAVASVAYYHVELGRHAVIMAEGAAAESFLNDGCRGQFHNAAQFEQLYPDAPAMTPLQARLEDGFCLQTMRERIAARAGVIMPVEPIGPLRGFLDNATPERICGWAQDADNPEQAVALEVLSVGRPVLCLLANAYRADLWRAGLGSGCHSFDMVLPPHLAGPVAVRRVTDGSFLPQALAVGASDLCHAA